MGYRRHCDAIDARRPKGTPQEVFEFAGLWDRSFAADGTAIESCVHITMPANPLMQDIHNTGKNPHRMPAILRKEDHEAWLKGSEDEARAGKGRADPNAMRDIGSHGQRYR
jgi:putative SOS response-associated peptidase YedK